MKQYRSIGQLVILGIVLVLFGFVIHRFLIPVTLGLIISLVFRPAYLWLRRKSNNSSHLPAALSTFIVLICVLLPLILLGIFVYKDASHLVTTLNQISKHEDKSSGILDIPVFSTVRSATAAVETARADRELAGNRRDAGRVTDADVLQLDVYLALATERQVQATSDEHIARARLNQLMGEPLGTTFSLDATPSAIAIDISNPGGLEEEALRNRPEVALALQHEQLAAAAVDAAQAAFLPQVAVQGGWELNGGAWNSRSSSWVAGAVVRINLFHGLADKARLAEAREAVRRRAIDRGKADTMARLDVQIAIARLEAARASEAVGRAAAEQARESRRIIRDRYESGLTDAAMLLRAADAVQQADAQQIAARVHVLTATASLQRATGRP